MVDRTDVTFPSGDAHCAAYLYRPDGEASGDVPCVVMAHGFSATRDDRLPAFAERFAAAGMAALVFDYRHFGASGGHPRQLLDVGRQHDDYRAAIAYVRGLDGIDPERIALWGSSFSGGHVVAVAAGDARLAAVVSQAPFADGLTTVAKVPPKNLVRLTVDGLRDKVGSLVGRPPHLIPAVAEPGGYAAMSAPEAVPGFDAITGEDSLWQNAFAARLMLTMALYRPVRSAPGVRAPLLVCVCDEDDTTPAASAVKMGETAPRGTVIRYPIGHFAIYVGGAFERAVADQTAFLQQHLLATAGPAARDRAGAAA
ncbi:alpha/beta hydrolase [Patulibacter sp.]|uniref:alpha/beta hydrolase n=1 Tax=Patulibacter sp. TaxID=1912859 RepID=UPI00271C3C62|nr:alpha/beta hydrolase [Patulibacter sp.]MDO9409896.1 alpha/beta fold hydrolase [Patulibacter sp.]